MKIGLLSDTHGYLDPKIMIHGSACDEIWHAGDLGDEQVIQQLESFKPLRAVFGNIDDPALQHRLPEDLWFECEGLKIWMTHIAGSPPHYNPRVRKILKARPPDLLVCGHSHILRVRRDPQQNNLLYLNPGAAGNQGFHAIRTMLRFEITSGKVGNMEVIELGKRGQLPQQKTMP